MTSYFEILVNLVNSYSNSGGNESNLSSYLIKSLNTLQKLDRTSRKLELYIKDNEKLIQEELKKQIAGKSTAELQNNFDETPFKEAVAYLAMCRNKRNVLIEKQMKIVNNCYEIIDKKINAFDENIKLINKKYPYIFPNSTDVFSPNSKKRKKASGNVSNNNELTNEEFDETLNDMMSRNKHEPKYCLCNRVSFGDMIACENEDCRIEWFHFRCVGLKKAPENQWFCPQCSKNLEINGTSQSPGTADIDTKSPVYIPEDTPSTP